MSFKINLFNPKKERKIVQARLFKLIKLNNGFLVLTLMYVISKIKLQYNV